jgi:molybdate transport system permease protein
VIDWTALRLSLELAAWTSAIILPLAIVVGRAMAHRRFAGKSLLQALLALPLVLPPTVLGFYLLSLMGREAALGRAFEAAFARPLAFSFVGLVAASLVANIPFALQPIERAFEAIAQDIREAAWTSGLSSWRAFVAIELPLAWRGIATAFVLVFAHTLGEFGVVLMIGGAIPGETRTAAIAIYDRVQAFDDAAAAALSAALLLIAFAATAAIFALGGPGEDKRRD